MKTINYIQVLLLFSIICFSCAKDSDEDLLTDNRCFVVRDRISNVALENATVTLMKSGSLVVTTSTTDNKGQVCLEGIKSDIDYWHKIVCEKDKYMLFVIIEPPSDFKEIYLERDFNYND